MEGKGESQSEGKSSRSGSQRQRGIALIVVGVLIIIGSVLYVLEVANGPGSGPKTFAERRSYNQVKQAVHGAFPLSLTVALGGLGLCILGSRWMQRSE